MRQLLKRIASAAGYFFIEVGTALIVYGGEFKRPKRDQTTEARSTQ